MQNGHSHLEFRTSSRCSDGCGGACVEFAQTDGGVVLQDTRQARVSYTDQEWRDFIDGVKRAEFDI